MACRSIEPLLPAYLDSDLPERAATRCAEHLATCPHCRQVLAGLQRLPGLLAAWQPPEPELPVGNQAAGWILERAAARRRSPVWSTRLGFAAAALVALALLFSHSWLEPRGGAPATGIAQQPVPPPAPAPPRPHPGPAPGNQLARSTPPGIRPAAAPESAGDRPAGRSTGSPPVRPPAAGAGFGRRGVRSATGPRHSPGAGRSTRETVRRSLLARRSPAVAREGRPASPGEGSPPVITISDDEERGRQVCIGPAREPARVEEGTAESR
jgi:hypothetical protein